MDHLMQEGLMIGVFVTFRQIVFFLVFGQALAEPRGTRPYLPRIRCRQRNPIAANRH